MSRPVIPPPPLRRPVPPGLWRATPPVIFSAILGLFALGLGWRQALAGSTFAGLAEMLLGAVTLLYLYAAVAYAAKPLRRAGVLNEEVRVLPGRAGLAAGGMAMMLLVLVLMPYAPQAARGIGVLAFVLHLALAAKLLRDWATGPAEARVITPVWHLQFVGFILLAMPAAAMGHDSLARAILYVTLPVALGIWAVSAVQLLRRIPPAPLRPMLAIHLTPLNIFAIVLHLLGHAAAAEVFAAAAVLVLAALLAAGRWLTVAGFSPLWGVFTFPLGSAAVAFLTVGWEVAGLVLLLAASAAVPVIAFRVLRDWARGSLAQRSNAAIA